MNDNDSFRLLTRDQAVMIGCFLIGIVAAIYGEDTPKSRTSPPVVQAPCATISQYGPGERWSRQSPPPQVADLPLRCAGADFSPNHVLSLPVVVAK